MEVCIKLIIAGIKPKTMLLSLDNGSTLDMMLDEIAKSTKISFIKESVTIKQYNEKFNEYIDIDSPYAEILVNDGTKYEVHVMLYCEKKQETPSKSQVSITGIATEIIQNLTSAKIPIDTSQTKAVENESTASNIKKYDDQTNEMNKKIIKNDEIEKIFDDDVDNKPITSTTSTSQSMNSEENNAGNIKENNDIDNKGNDTKEAEIKKTKKTKISKSNEEKKIIKNKNKNSSTTNQEIVKQKLNTAEIIKESDTKTSKISSSNDTSTSLKANKLHGRVTVEKLEKILPEPIVPELKHTINYKKTKVAYAENPYFKDGNTIETTQARGYIESTAHREIHYGDTPHDETLTRSNVTQYTAMLGDLYDATRDKFIGMNIFTSKNLPNDAYQTFENHSVDSEYVISNKLSDKLNLLKIDGELALSILSGIAPITGSAGYLNEKRHTHNSVQCNFIYKKRTINENLHITSDVLRPYFCPSIGNEGTHVIIGISYGANATISLTYEYSKETSKTDLFGMIGIGTDKHKEKDAKTDVVPSIVTDIFDHMINIFGGGSVSAQKLNTKGLDEKKMKLKVFADIEANVGATPNTIQEAMEFIRNIPTFITGKGKQIEFILFPLSILKKRLNLQIEVDRLYCHIQADTIKHIEHIFDRIEESSQKLNEIEAMIKKYQAFTSKTEKERIRKFRFNFDTSVSKFREELGQLVQKVRSGKPIDQLNAIRKVFEDDPNIGSKQIGKFEESCEPLKEKFTLLEEFETHGVVLITTSSELFQAKNKAIGQELYLLFFSFNDEQRDPKWDDVIRYFLQRCGEIEDLQNNPTDKDLNEIFMAIDIDLIPGIMKKEGLNDGLRICLIIDNEYVDKDVYANDYEFIINKPIVQCNSKMLINDEVKDQKSLSLACPKSFFGGRCDKKETAWYCSRCRQEILYGFDEHFYCECGHQAVNSYGFKCGSKMHGIKYVPFDKDVLSKLLSKMKLEPTSSKNKQFDQNAPIKTPLNRNEPIITTQANLEKSPYLMSFRNKIFICRSDITKIAVDAIVNATNSSLLGCVGVDDAIHLAAGYKLLEECKEIGGCNTGDAKITHSYNISQIKAIIHTVGPNIRSRVTERDEKLLSNCYWNSLELAKKCKLSSIAFPCISTGFYSYPNGSAAIVALNTVKRWLETNDNASKMRAIVFVIFTRVDYDVYRKNLPKVFPIFTDNDNSFNFERSFNDVESPDDVQTKENKPKEGGEKNSADESIKMEVAESQS